MAYEQKDNSGSLFKNQKKQQESHADYNGKLKANGVMYFMDAWLNESKNGTKYLSVKIKPMEGGPAKSEAKSEDLPW